MALATISRATSQPIHSKAEGTNLGIQTETRDYCAGWENGGLFNCCEFGRRGECAVESNGQHASMRLKSVLRIRLMKAWNDNVECHETQLGNARALQSESVGSPRSNPVPTPAPSSSTSSTSSLLPSSPPAWMEGPLTASRRWEGFKNACREAIAVVRTRRCSGSLPPNSRGRTAW